MGSNLNILYRYFLSISFIFCFTFSFGQANLPFFLTSWATAGIGVTYTGVTQRNTSSACTGNDAAIFDNTGERLEVFINSAPSSVTFQLKKQSMSGNSYITVEESSNGSTWSTIGIYGTATSPVATSISDCGNITINLNCTSRYIRWTYTKATGNCDIDELSISSYTGTCGASCNTFSVSYDANGGSGSLPSTQTGSVDVTVSTASAISNGTCTFISWNTLSNGSGTSYIPGNTYLCTAGTTTLYAQWNCSGVGPSCSGAIGNGKTQGCGDSSPCDLSTYATYLDGVSCYTVLNSSCTGACDVQAPFSKIFMLPSGCTATITAEMKVRSAGCGNSGMDSGDQLAISNSGGSIISQAVTLSNGGTISGSSINKNSGTGNADGWVQMVVTSGVVTVSGSGQRGDEIVTYTINLSGSCGTDCNTLLPITLINFYGVHYIDKNDIIWKVAREENIIKYVVEKSKDGINFEYLKDMYPSNGYVDKTYLIEDYNPFENITYYRLATVEKDYSIQYYSTIFIEEDIDKLPNYNLYFNNNITIDFKNSLPKNTSISLFDLSGKLLIEAPIVDSQTKINTQNFADGIYFLKISTPYKTQNHKVIIQNQ